MTRLFIRLDNPVFDDRGNITAADTFVLSHDGAHTPCWVPWGQNMPLSDNAHELVLAHTPRAGLHIVRRVKNGKAYAGSNYKLRAAGLHVLRLGAADDLGYALASPQQTLTAAEDAAVTVALKRLTLPFVQLNNLLEWLFAAPLLDSPAHLAEAYVRADHRRFVKANQGQLDPAKTRAAIHELQALLGA